MQDRKPVKPLFQDVPQLTLVFGVELPVLGVLPAPFLSLHRGACEDQQVPIVKCIRGAGARQQEANGVAAPLKMLLEPAAEALIDLVWLLREQKNGKALVPTVGVLSFIEGRPWVG